MSVGQDFGSLAGWFWLRSSDVVTLKVLARLQTSEGLIRAEGSAKMAVGKRPGFLTTGTLQKAVFISS